LFPFSLFRNFRKDELPAQRGLISVSIFHHPIVLSSYIYFVQATLLKVFTCYWRQKLFELENTRIKFETKILKELVGLWIVAKMENA